MCWKQCIPTFFFFLNSSPCRLLFFLFWLFLGTSVWCLCHQTFFWTMIRSLRPTPLQLHNLSDAQLLFPVTWVIQHVTYHWCHIINRDARVCRFDLSAAIKVEWGTHRHWSLGDIRSFFLLASLRWFIILHFLAMCTSSTFTFLFPGHCHLPSRGLLGKFCKIDGSLGFPS